MTALIHPKWNLFEELLLQAWTHELARSRRLGLPAPRLPKWSDVAGPDQTQNNQIAIEKFLRAWPMSVAASEILSTSRKANKQQKRKNRMAWPQPGRHVPSYVRGSARGEKRLGSLQPQPVHRTYGNDYYRRKLSTST